MKYASLRAVLAATGILCALGGLAATSTTAPDAGPKESPPGVAVVELFTSEGCSSCPSAERVLNDLHASNAKKGGHVYTLAFHVDYWNHLGWPDRFATEAFTARQRTYADRLGSGVYTPQMVVNGAAEFVGSDRGRADAEIARALATPAAVPLTFEVQAGDAATGARPVAIHAPAGAGLGVAAALTHSGLSTSVKRGENSGRALTHDGVVRAFATGTLDKEGRATVRLALAADAAAEAGPREVIVFVYDAKTPAIKGAAAGAWPSASTPAR
ncbi:MAG: DUF1223 domain-containing protein [Phycisphaerales bacterium]